MPQRSSFCGKLPEPTASEPRDDAVCVPNAPARAPAPDAVPKKAAKPRLSKWGHVAFHRKSEKTSPPFGGIEAVCPYHALNQKTGCKKFLSFAGNDEESKACCIQALRHWCNQALQFDRQRAHIRMPLRPQDIPPASVVDAQLFHGA